MWAMQEVHPLRTYRESRDPKLSQAALAALLGVDRLTVVRWETGVRRIDQDKLPEISSKTGIPAADLRPDLARLFGASS